jgi:cyclase
MSISFLKLTKVFSLSALFIITSNQLIAEEEKLSFSTTEVAPGLYMLMGVGGFTGGNIGLSVGEDGVVMIDDSMPPMLDIMKTAIATVTDKPVDFLINTHVHGDHIGNNEAMGKSGTWIVAHKNLRSHLLEKGVSTSEGNVPTPKDALPMITFSESMDFHLNGYDAHIFHVERAHTNGDIVIFYKAPNVIHMGDVMFNGLFPYIDISKGGSVDGYIAAQQQALKFINLKTKIISGHGPLAYKADLEKSNAMIIDARNIIADLIKAGKSEAQVVELNPLAKYHDDWNWGFITTEKMTIQVYKSLTETK